LFAVTYYTGYLFLYRKHICGLLSKAVAIAPVSSTGMIGLLIGPLIMGFIAGLISLKISFLILFFLALQL